MITSDEKYIKKCITLAKKAGERGDVPVGCVIVYDDKVIASSSNRREKDYDPTAHAEILALRKAGEKLGRKNLSGCTLFVTLEPCVMCAGAIVNSRIDRVVFGAFDKRFGCAGSVMNLVEENCFNHRAKVTGGVLERECAELLTDFFTRLREEKKQKE